MLSSKRRSSQPTPARCRPDPHRRPLSPAWWLAAATLPILAAAWAGVAHGQAQGSLTVQAQVEGACTVGTATLSFPSYVAGQSTPVTADTIFSVSCGPGLAIDIKLGGGNNLDGSQRQMSNGNGGLLEYNLHKAASLNDIWGDGIFADALSIPSFNSGSHGSQVVFGEVLGGQNVSPGPYSDQVTITVDLASQ